MPNFLKILLQHKFIAGALILVLIIGGYYGFKKIRGSSASTQYVSAQVQKGTLVVSVSGSGQVSASNELDVKPKVSGDVVAVFVTNGQELKTGQLILQLDTTDARKALQTAQTNLEQAQVNLSKITGTTTDSGTLRSEKEKAAADLEKAYSDGFNAVDNSFLTLPDVMTGIHDILFSRDFTASQWNVDYYADAVALYDPAVLKYRDDAYNAYQAARQSYDQNFADYKSTSRFAGPAVIEALINETYGTAGNIAEALKDANSLIRFYQDQLAKRNLKPQTLSDTHLSSLSTYISQSNSVLTSLFSAKNTIINDKEAVVNSDFDLANQQNQLRQVQDALTTAQENLADCSLYAPFSGVITNINVEKGDSVSQGSSVATLITKQQITEISLNEIDITKVKTGQKATLTFDAIPDLTLTGRVSDVDTIGTVSQGVVTYNVKISFDTQDDRVKPGMSVSADIITDVAQDALLVPNSAISLEGSDSYVEIITGNSNFPQQQLVTTGLSNDTMTEITSGLQEGDMVVTQTISSSAATQSRTQTNSAFRIFGGGGAVGR
jgi:HlyD family secretion protein